MTVLDTPAQISAWYFLSAISQLSFEVKTGHNWYGKTSVLKGIQQHGWTSVEGRATKRAKVLALSELLDTAHRIELDTTPNGVVASGEETLAQALAELGAVIERQYVPVAG